MAKPSRGDVKRCPDKHIADAHQLSSEQHAEVVVTKTLFDRGRNAGTSPVASREVWAGSGNHPHTARFKADEQVSKPCQRQPLQGLNRDFEELSGLPAIRLMENTNPVMAINAADAMMAVVKGITCARILLNQIWRTIPNPTPTNACSFLCRLKLDWMIQMPPRLNRVIHISKGR